MTERLDKGLLDFGVLIEPVHLEGYDYLRLPATDTWGLLLRRDHPLARLPAIRPKDLEGVPLLTSRQRMVDNEFASWLGQEGHSLTPLAPITSSTTPPDGGGWGGLRLDGRSSTPRAPSPSAPWNPGWRPT